jgi:hypothetical protein
MRFPAVQRRQKCVCSPPRKYAERGEGTFSLVSIVFVGLVFSGGGGRLRAYGTATRSKKRWFVGVCQRGLQRYRGEGSVVMSGKRHGPGV